MHLYALCFSQGLAPFKERDGGLLRDQVPSDVLIGGARAEALGVWATAFPATLPGSAYDRWLA
ncbi:hypothetical protein LZ189_23765, partial [Rhodovulum sulfidophilum]|nr:hypothetical protein [Rhodovulum sulfidophilum]